MDSHVNIESSLSVSMAFAVSYVVRIQYTASDREKPPSQRALVVQITLPYLHAVPPAINVQAPLPPPGKSQTSLAFHWLTSAQDVPGYARLWELSVEWLQDD